MLEWISIGCMGKIGSKLFCPSTDPLYTVEINNNNSQIHQQESP